MGTNLIYTNAGRQGAFTMSKNSLAYIITATILSAVVIACQPTNVTNSKTAASQTTVSSATHQSLTAPNLASAAIPDPASTLMPDTMTNAMPSPSKQHVAMTASTPMTDFQAASMQSMHEMHQAMMAGLQANDADNAFASGMIAHHQGAIAMAMIEQQYGKNATMRKLAEDIITAQQNEIQLMQTWLDHHPDNPKKTADTKAMQQEFNNGMGEMQEQMMQGAMMADPDKAFAQSMLPHHKGALAMAQVELKYGDDNKMRALADNIISTQQAEIKLMQSWLKAQH